MRTETSRLPLQAALDSLAPETVGLFLYNGMFQSQNALPVESIEVAHIFRLHDIRNWNQGGFFIQFTEAPVQPLPDGRKCLIERALTGTVIDLLKAAPTNELARGHALNQLKVAIPDEIKTFDEIKEWVEKNCEPKIRATAPALGTPAFPRGGTDLAFRFPINRTETQFGRCRFRVNASGTEQFGFTVNELQDWIDDQIERGGNLTDVIESMEQDILDNAEVDCESDDDYSYEEYEVEDTADGETTWSSDNLRDRLESWMSENLPDELQQLIDNE